LASDFITQDLRSEAVPLGYHRPRSAKRRLVRAHPLKIAAVFGTRPEAIKMMPVLREIGARAPTFSLCNIITSQHTDLLDPLLLRFQLSAHHCLGVLRPGQTLDQLLSRLLAALDTVLEQAAPDLLLVQGDTTSALAGSLAAHHHRIPVVHIEAGLRSGDRLSPFPEEMNRRLITRLATYHMAATPHNVQTLLAEGVPPEHIFLTGNPIVDALEMMLASTKPSDQLLRLLDDIEGQRIIVLTSHRRENFGTTMRGYFEVLRQFVEAHSDVTLIFPVHPNPAVRQECGRVGLSGPSIRLIEPLIYSDFLHLLCKAWLVVSDSGGVQEEVPSLGKPLLVIRENTERPEALTSGCARLVGRSPETLARMLDELAADDTWIRSVRGIANPFGNGHSAKAIVDSFTTALNVVESEGLMAS
jgi:UDP-N-acetylglucosamine 2-epimerase (non-hydrolysing)